MNENLIKINQLIDIETCTYTYIVYDSNTRKAIIIDPVYNQVERDF